MWKSGFDIRWVKLNMHSKHFKGVFKTFQASTTGALLEKQFKDGVQYLTFFSDVKYFHFITDVHYQSKITKCG